MRAGFYFLHFNSFKCVFFNIKLLFSFLKCSSFRFPLGTSCGFYESPSFAMLYLLTLKAAKHGLYGVDLYQSSELRESLAFYFSTISYPENESVCAFARLTFEIPNIVIFPLVLIFVISQILSYCHPPMI